MSFLNSGEEISSMGVDFSKLLDEDDECIINPRDIFLSSNKNSRFSFPRDIQTEVMNRWFECRDSRDCVIKLNVGSGKTLVGLLLLQTSLNEGKGPALYVTPDNQLKQQVVREAEALGIKVTEDPNDPAYGAREQICVVNVHKLFNGKSVFGVDCSQVGIGTAVIDDAHACVSTVTKQFRISLANTHDAYKRIFKAVSEDLKGYNMGRFLELKDSDPQARMEVPFWSWAAHQDEIIRALSKNRDEEDLRFAYPLLRETLPQCRCVIGGQRLEIEPHFPMTDVVRSFARAKRRL